MWIEIILLYTKADDIYNDIAEDVESTFDTSNYDQIEHYQKEKIKK